LFQALPPHLAAMALFAVNTGCRDAEVCRLHRDWEVQVPELGTSVFIVPGRYVKNGDDRLIVLNRIALSLVEAQRGKHRSHVLTYKGKLTTRMLTRLGSAPGRPLGCRRCVSTTSSTPSAVVSGQPG